jgi:hypothetical protein
MNIKQTLLLSTLPAAACKAVLALSLILGPLKTIAQAPAIQWQKTIGGTGNDLANSVRNTKDGGYIVAGTTTSNDHDLQGMNVLGADCLVEKLDAAGNIVWKKRYGGSSMDWGEAIKQTADNGYILVSSSASADGDINNHHGNAGVFDIWVVKLDSVGNIQWQKSFGGSADDVAQDVVQTDDGGFGIIGYTSSRMSGDVGINKGPTNMWVIRLDKQGNIKWQQTMGGSRLDAGRSIDNTKNGGFVVAGETTSQDGDVSSHYGFGTISDAWLAVLDSNGHKVWDKNYGGTGDDVVMSVRATEDGGYIFTGSTNSRDVDVSGLHLSFDPATGDIIPDYWVVKINATGAIEWQKCLGGKQRDEAEQVVPTADGGYIVAGASRSVDGDVRNSHSVVIAPAGYSSDFWLTKLSAAGALEWEKSLGGAGWEHAICMTVTPDGGYIVVGTTDSTHGDVTRHYGSVGTEDQWIAKLAATPAAVKQTVATNKSAVYPNPAMGAFFIRSTAMGVPYRLINITGQTVLTGTIEHELTQVKITGVSTGTYYLQTGNEHPEYHKLFIAE